MIPKIKEREQAIRLRKKGKTYNEILKAVPVAKSTLSRWLREVGLSKPQKQVLTRKRKEAQAKGARRKREIRIEKQKRIIAKARSEIGNLSKRELFLIGVALYWAEGSKEKEYRTGCMTEFCNTDGAMVALYLKWLTDIVRIDPSDIVFRIYIHQTSGGRLKEVKKYWSDTTGFPVHCFNRFYFKKHNIRTVRKRVGENYYGMLDITVKRSIDLNRRIYGWVQGILQEY